MSDKTETQESANAVVTPADVMAWIGELTLMAKSPAEKTLCAILAVLCSSTVDIADRVVKLEAGKDDAVRRPGRPRKPVVEQTEVKTMIDVAD